MIEFFEKERTTVPKRINTQSRLNAMLLSYRLYHRAMSFRADGSADGIKILPSDSGLRWAIALNLSLDDNLISFTDRPPSNGHDIRDFIWQITHSKDVEGNHLKCISLFHQYNCVILYSKTDKLMD